MEPFTLDVFISKRFVSASLTHRVTSKQVAVAGTNSKDIKAALKSRSDIPACLAIGRILADRAREADVYTASYTPRDRDKFEGKIRAVVQSLTDNGIDVKALFLILRIKELWSGLVFFLLGLGCQGFCRERSGMGANKIEQGQGYKFPRGGNVRNDSTKRVSDDEEDGKVEVVTRLSSTTGGPVESDAADVANVNTNGLRGWQKSSGIIMVSRASPSKDRHRKVWTSKGLRDRRVTLSVHTAIQFYDVQDRLGYDRPSKAVEWLIKAADSIVNGRLKLEILVLHHLTGAAVAYANQWKEWRSRPSEDRTIPLSIIAERTKLSIEDVGHLLMKSLLVHLIEGIIDQAEGTVHVSWVQPRVLGVPQIKSLRDRLDNWLDKVHTALLSVEAEAPDLVAS
ncbi:hypothetical protein SO802_000144 [Lithocarpus litseifolius]|uniref:TCP domain-containing protein n=1 Tax=Lithocarpus litseifolius TaxID=425828 RepID=A0AAW2DUY6_9ROSI